MQLQNINQDSKNIKFTGSFARVEQRYNQSKHCIIYRLRAHFLELGVGQTSALMGTEITKRFTKASHVMTKAMSTCILYVILM